MTASHEGRIAALEARVEKIDADLRVNTLLTSSIKGDTEELIGLFKASKWVVRAFSWLAGILTSVGAMYAMLKGFKL